MSRPTNSNVNIKSSGINTLMVCVGCAGVGISVGIAMSVFGAPAGASAAVGLILSVSLMVAVLGVVSEITDLLR